MGTLRLFNAFGMIKHLLDRALADIRFVVQIVADGGLSFTSSNINLNLHNKSNVKPGSFQQVYNIKRQGWHDLV